MGNSIRGPIQDYFSNAHSDGLIVLVGANPSLGSASDENIINSQTGAAWHTSVKATTLDVYSVAFSPVSRIWVAINEVNVTYTTDTLVSADGTTWSTADNNIVLTTGATDNNIIWDETNDLFAMHSGRTSAYSSNGTSWTAGGTMGLTYPYDDSSRVKDIIWVDDQSKYVAVGFASSVTTMRISSWTSTDMTSWTQTEGATSARLDSVTWSSSLSLYAATGLTSSGDETFYTSTNGTAWTLRQTETLGITNTDHSVIWCEALTLFVATFGGLVGSDAWGYIYTSPDGTTWTERHAEEFQFISQVRWDAHNARLLAVGDDMRVSTDGITWTDVSTPLYNAWDIAIR